MRGKGLEPFNVSPGTGNYRSKCQSLVWIGSVPPWPRRNATPHQTHEFTIELFIMLSLTILIIAKTKISNPNKISTCTSIFTINSKPLCLCLKVFIFIFDNLTNALKLLYNTFNEEVLFNNDYM